MPLAIPHSKVGPPVNGELFAPGHPAPAVILLHEWWGLNDQIRGIARKHGLPVLKRLEERGDLPRSGFGATHLDAGRHGHDQRQYHERPPAHLKLRSLGAQKSKFVVSRHERGSRTRIRRTLLGGFWSRRKM